MGSLTMVKAKAIKEPGRYSDGNGLQLVVKASGAKSWILRVQHNGRRRDIGLGSFSDVGPAEARERAVETRKVIRGGGDPTGLKNDSGRISGRPTTFRELATSYHEDRKASWKNAKHREQWLSTLETYAFPVFGDQPVDRVDSRDVLDCLKPIWNAKPETARRVLQRVLRVLNYARGMGHREHEAPTQSIRAALGKQRSQVRHHASLPYAEMPELMTKLEAASGVGAMALRFAIVTAARSGEVRGAQWNEMDLVKKTWTIPAERMKAGRAHAVPLSPAALAILEDAKGLRKKPEGFVFPSSRGIALSDMTLLKAIRAASDQNPTVHGCRTSFRVWAAEKTSFPAAAAEAALAHTIPNKAEAAYHRTDYLDIRRSLMADWGAFLAGG